MIHGATRAGQFGAARGPDGRQPRSGRVVAAHRTPGGDYHQHRTAHTVTLAPWTATPLLDRLAELAPRVATPTSPPGDFFRSGVTRQGSRR